MLLIVRQIIHLLPYGGMHILIYRHTAKGIRGLPVVGMGSPIKQKCDGKNRIIFLCCLAHHRSIIIIIIIIIIAFIINNISARN